MEKKEKKDFDFELATKEQAPWIELKDRLSKAIEQSEREIQINMHVIELCNSKIDAAKSSSG